VLSTLLHVSHWFQSWHPLTRPVYFLFREIDEEDYRLSYNDNSNATLVDATSLEELNTLDEKTGAFDEKTSMPTVETEVHDGNGSEVTESK
jgi:hypothetical protein